MGASFDTILENRAKLTLEQLKDSLREKGIDVNMDSGVLSAEQLMCITADMTENTIMLSGYVSMLSTEQQRHLNTGYLHRWNRLVVQVMEIVNTKFAVSTEEAPLFAAGMKVPLKKLWGIFFDTLDEPSEYLASLEVEDLEKEKAKEVIESSITHREVIGNITCAFFMYFKERQRFLANRLIENLQDEGRLVRA